MALTGREMTEAARQAVAKIPHDQLQAQLAAGASIVVLDVREKEEWDAGHIPQGTLLPRGRLEGRVEELVPDKTTAIVTH
jgi:phage shock protein E